MNVNRLSCEVPEHVGDSRPAAPGKAAEEVYSSRMLISSTRLCSKRNHLSVQLTQLFHDLLQFMLELLSLKVSAARLFRQKRFEFMPKESQIWISEDIVVAILELAFPDGRDNVYLRRVNFLFRRLLA